MLEIMLLISAHPLQETSTLRSSSLWFWGFARLGQSRGEAYVDITLTEKLPCFSVDEDCGELR